MTDIAFTPQQRSAIESVGKSSIVSAAAGSGKTAVLVERCVHVTCDLPEHERCDVDQLLVLTFTEAAAAQMRSRIIEAIQERARRHPEDQRLREQVTLVEASQISTIHSFCLWLVRRWFSQLGLDPAASILDEHEATLMKQEVIDEIFRDLYAQDGSTSDPLGIEEIHQPSGMKPDAQDPLFKRFIHLVDDYGLGEDGNITEFVLRLYEFTSSLPDPDQWLQESVDALSKHPEQTTLTLFEGLSRELTSQIDHCKQLIQWIKAGHSAGHYYAEQIENYTSQLNRWLEKLPKTLHHDKKTLEQIESVRCEIDEFKFDKKQGPRLSKDIDPEILAQRDRANDAWKDVKKRLYQSRLHKHFGLFSIEEWIDGLIQTSPYVKTLVELVSKFRKIYDSKKREISVMDFSDLEQFAYTLLRSDDDPKQPSDVARTLHRKFRHVLVDEFQDINPIQKEILKLVSHESDPDQPDNLFVVGDVKQSIYRFRLAEPAIFTRRFERFIKKESTNEAIPLQQNFRSRHELLEAINHIFSRLMKKDTCEIEYDESARLQPGRTLDPPDQKTHPVEVHLIEKKVIITHEEENSDVDATDDQQRGIPNFNDPTRWTAIEREAYVIGSRIREWIASQTCLEPDQPIRYRDIVILLRATKINAERMAAMLNAMDIPAYAATGGSLFSALEVRDVLAVLQLLDNMQQDIPLAAVLRSGIMGDIFSEDELVKIRCLDREIPFHEVVRRYINDGTDNDLRDRLELFYKRIQRYRDQIRRKPLSDVLWSLYEQQNYLAYVSGLPNAAQRRANLFKLHEIARKFSTFRRQGLFRFLRFMESLVESKQDIATAASIGESEDVVRIMSIHQAKGLEFPVVFIAGLGTKFNLGDRNGRMIFERRTKIGLRVLDTEKMLEYPSVTHQLAATEIEHTARAEELRVLYVAMTRAMDRLILVGSRRNVQNILSAKHDFHHLATRLNLGSAESFMDWLIPAITDDEADTKKRLFDIQLYKPEDMLSWQVEGPTDPLSTQSRKAASRLQALPSDEPFAPNDSEVQQVLSRIEYVYPQLSVTSVRATVGAGEFKGAFDFTRSDEQRPDLKGYDHVFDVPPSKYLFEADDSPTQRGIFTHRILEHLDFRAAIDQRGLDQELQRMTEAGITTEKECGLLDRSALVWFLSTPLAQSIREAGDTYQREFYYSARETPTYFDPSVETSPDDFILVRGIVDGILPVADGIEIIDFKTDSIGSDQLADRVDRYRSQMDLYRRAMSSLWNKPVRNCSLVFLAAREIISVFHENKQP